MGREGFSLTVLQKLIPPAWSLPGKEGGGVDPNCLAPRSWMRLSDAVLTAAPPNGRCDLVHIQVHLPQGTPEGGLVTGKRQLALWVARLEMGLTQFKPGTQNLPV